MRYVRTLRFLSLPMTVLGTALTLGCSSDGAPTAPDESPSFAAYSGPLTVDPRSLRITCNVGLPCTGGIIVGATSSVTLSYQVTGDFEINGSLTTCPQGGTLTGTCFLNVRVTTTTPKGRRLGTVVISESTTGTSRTVKLVARLS